MKSPLLTSLITAAALAAPITAQGSPLDRGPAPLPGLSTTVDLSSFNFSTVDGVARAHRRIVSTAYQLCSVVLNTVRSDQRLYRDCIARTVNNAVWRAGHPNLTSFHAALSPKQKARIRKPVPTGWSPLS